MVISQITYGHITDYVWSYHNSFQRNRKWWPTRINFPCPLIVSELHGDLHWSEVDLYCTLVGNRVVWFRWGPKPEINRGALYTEDCCIQKKNIFTMHTQCPHKISVQHISSDRDRLYIKTIHCRKISTSATRKVQGFAGGKSDDMFHISEYEWTRKLKM